MEAREVALLVLNQSQRQGNWSDGLLKRQLSAAKLDSREAALATQLCYGVLQNQTLLDFYLSHFSNMPPKRMEAKVLQALRLGAYQLLFLDRIPPSAAVNSAVDLTRTHSKNSRAAGMVNAVLRSLHRNLDSLPPVPSDDPVSYLSILYSHPEWLVKEFLLTLGREETEALLKQHNAQPPLHIMVNTTRTSPQELTQALDGVEVTAHPWLEQCLLVSKTGNIEQLPAFAQGLFYVQDPASWLAVQAANPQPLMRVLDCCAAPGGKSFAAAIQMCNQGEIISCDLHPHKKALIQAGAQRLQLDCITPVTADAGVFHPEWEARFDLVMVDAPCSGLGVIRKKPDIRYKDPALLEQLPRVQTAILANAARYVKPGGVLLYSTCTVRKQENEDVVDTLLAQDKSYKEKPFTLPDPIGHVPSGRLTLWPHRQGTDGFFLTTLQKEG